MNRLSFRWLRAIDPGEAAWFLAWFSLPVSLKLSGLAVILAALVHLFAFIRNPFRAAGWKILYLLAPVLFFAWSAAELFTARPLMPAWKETERMLSLLVIPLTFLISRTGRAAYGRAAAAGLLTALTLCGSVMLGAATLRFSHSGDPYEFIYHRLALPFHTGAVYFSCYLLFALFIAGEAPFSARIRTLIILFLLLLLLLSASKLFIGLGLPLLAIYYGRKTVSLRKHHKAALAAGILILILFSVPFVQRAKRILHPDLSLVGRENFRGIAEPDGLTLRLVLWRFGFDILREQKAWFTGTGMVQSQRLLDEKITSDGLYTGVPGTPDHGYLGYNFHDQYLETLVRKGVPGLLLLLAILLIFAFQPQRRLFAPKLFMWVMAGFFLTESVLQRQAGVVFFCLIYCACFDPDEDTPALSRTDC